MKVYDENKINQLTSYDLNYGLLKDDILYHVDGSVERIKVYIPFDSVGVLARFRELREVECFSIVNRGALWYNTLSEEQIIELNNWYLAWLDVTETKIIPQKPEWLK